VSATGASPIVTDPATALAQVAGRFIRLAAAALAFTLAAALCLEVAGRLLGAKPQLLYQTGLVSATMPDTWTGWAMRPDVRYSEYTVTNGYGLHEDREVTLGKPSGMKRIAVLGSSVAWGLGLDIKDTVPRAAEASLQAAGCEAQVLNFGGIGFNILNTSAFLQTKVHQFHPDAVVILMDLQMAVPRFPVLSPGAPDPRSIKTLGTLEAWFKRATEYSVVLTWLDDPASLRVHLKAKQPLPVEPPTVAKAATAPTRSQTYGKRALEKFFAAVDSWTARMLEPLKSDDVAGAKARVGPAAPAAAPPPRSLASHEERHERELGATVAALASFAREMGIEAYFVTPYGPYFHATPQEIKLFSLNMLQEAADLYGGIEPTLRREAELSSVVIARSASAAGARVIDMLPASREATMASGDFSSDGIHFTAQGNHHLGTLIAERLRRDGLCGPARR
jgi:hypothetical protein